MHLLWALGGLWIEFPDAPSLTKDRGREWGKKSKGKEERKMLVILSTPSAPVSVESGEHSKSGREGRGLAPQNLLGSHRLWNVCPYTPRCPQSDKDTVSWGPMWDVLNPGPTAAGRPGSSAHHGTAADLRGPHSCAQNSAAIVSKASSDLMGQGTPSPKNQGGHREQPQITVLLPDGFLPSPQGLRPRHPPRSHLGKDKGQERMALRAGMGLKGLLQTGGDS